MTSQSVTFKFEWNVSNFTRDELMKPNFFAHSEIMHLQLGDNKSQWKVVLETYEMLEEKYLSIFLCKISIDEDNLDVKFKISLGHEHGYLECPSTYINPNWGCSDVVKFSKLFDDSFMFVDKDNCLKILFEIELSTQSPPLIPRSKSFSHFMVNAKFYDFTLQSSDNVEFQVHRVILAESSSFFMTLFSVDMQEKDNKKVIFEDINAITLKEVLRFIYTEKAHVNNVQMATDVLYAAEKFLMNDLKAVCISELMGKVTKRNVLKILVTADMYKAENLEKKCLDCILRNYTLLRSSDEWKGLDFSLLQKITDAFAKLEEEGKIKPITFTTSL